ncbi:Sporulation related domain-containing protein [Salinihabitans flavidus]|uniref:Sporulation related domain-containing protein n=1 Tax=Salinihabitans flavidus TaxID=569882 RepID=A0A1H8Q7D8_9RHOB|nr:SPOR domain-containing protein [Salinihabitans flavidus]SEO50162.1 Sporulation related domain-containing protein [Salinihabitans flavidus]
MLRIKRLAIASTLFSLGLGAVGHAQSKEVPAEFPPASYQGKQYVDSRGCVYVRAGIDGNVTWVPRVARSREVVCGYKPTFAEAVRSTDSAARLGPEVERIEPDSPAAATATSRPKPETATKPRAASKPAESPEKVVRRKVAPKPQSAPATPAPAPKVKPRRSADQPEREAGVESRCRGASELSQRYIGSDKYNVRCGPQAELPYTPGTGNPTAEPPIIRINRGGRDDHSSAVRPGQRVGPGDVAPDRRVIPAHLYQRRQLALATPEPPEGYRRVWEEDGRFNPLRAEQNFAGKARMDRTWTRRVPREHIDRRTGQSYTETVVTRAAQSPAKAPVAQAAPRRKVADDTVSTRSAPAQKAIRLAGGGFVQVATYDDADAAQAAAQKVKRLGLPAKIGRYQKDGRTLRMVIAGPFAKADTRAAALREVRRRGFSGAFIRN